MIKTITVLLLVSLGSLSNAAPTAVESSLQTAMLRKAETIEGWRTIRPQSSPSAVLDYGDDAIGSSLVFRRDDKKNDLGVINVYDTGMKEYDSQSLFIKPIDPGAAEIRYRLITPNGWKVSEKEGTNTVLLEEDDGGLNQMWQITPDENGCYLFVNALTGNYLDFNDYPQLQTSAEPEPIGQQFLLYDRCYTGWDWYYDCDFGKYYLNGEEQAVTEKPFYEEGNWGSVYTGLVWNDGSWLYVHLGEPDYSFVGITYLNNNWWYVENGTINKDFEGLVEYNYNLWYVSEGKYDRSYNGTYYSNGTTYQLENGRVINSY